MPGTVSFISNVNKLVDKLTIIESANNIFDEGVIPILTDIAALNLQEAIADLKKGNYLGNRKLDIDLALNIPGITQSVIDDDILNSTNIARDIRLAAEDNIPRYSGATITFNDGDIVELPFLNQDGNPSPVNSIAGLLGQFVRTDIVDAVSQVDTVFDIVPVNNTLYTIVINGDTFNYVSDSNATITDIVTSFNQIIGNSSTEYSVSVSGNTLVITSSIPGTPIITNVEPMMIIIDSLFDRTIAAIHPANFASYSVSVSMNGTTETYTYTSGASATTGEITAGLVSEINNGSLAIHASTDTTNILLESDVLESPFSATVESNMRIENTIANVVAGSAETAFNSKLVSNNIISAQSVPTDILRIYDVIGQSSNIENIVLHVSGGSANESNPIFYWALTTSSFQVLAMRAGDIIRLGNELDNLLTLTNNIQQLLTLQQRIPELIDTYVNNVAQGDVTIYNNLSELMYLYDHLAEVVTLYAIRSEIVTVSDNIIDVSSVSTNIASVNTVSTNMNDVNAVSTNIADIVTVSTDLNLGNSSNILKVSTSINDVLTVSTNIASVNTVSTNIEDISSVVTNINAILDAENNASIATAQAAIATAQAIIATDKASYSNR